MWALAWNTFRVKLIQSLKSKFIQLALKKILGTAAAGGFKAWIVKKIATEFYEELAEPLMNYMFNEAEYQATVVEGKLIVKKLDKAREEGNAEDYNDATDSTFN